MIRRFMSTMLNKPQISVVSNNQTLETIREEFRQFRGGAIDLIKDESNGLAQLVFNNPEKRNSISGKMMAEISDKLLELENWTQGKAIIIRGNNGYFCSGGDLTTINQIDSKQGKDMSHLMHNNMIRLQSLPLISCAVIEGRTLGGGAEISTACDFRVMARDAYIGFVHVKMEIVSAWGGGSRLVHLIGAKNALDLMASGRQVSAEEALKLGLVDGVIDPNSCPIEWTKDWLKKYLCFTADTLHGVKGIVNSARYLPLEIALSDELEYSARYFCGTVHKKHLEKNLKHN